MNIGKHSWILEFVPPKTTDCNTGTWVGNVWWRHDVETFSAWLALCEENSQFTGGFHSQRASNWEHCCFLWCILKQTVKLPVIWDTMTSLWHQCNGFRGVIPSCYTRTYQSCWALVWEIGRHKVNEATAYLYLMFVCSSRNRHKCCETLTVKPLI